MSDAYREPLIREMIDKTICQIRMERAMWGLDPLTDEEKAEIERSMREAVDG